MGFLNGLVSFLDACAAFHRRSGQPGLFESAMDGWASGTRNALGETTSPPTQSPTFAPPLKPTTYCIKRTTVGPPGSWMMKLTGITDYARACQIAVEETEAYANNTKWVCWVEEEN